MDDLEVSGVGDGKRKSGRWLKWPDLGVQMPAYGDLALLAIWSLVMSGFVFLVWAKVPPENYNYGWGRVSATLIVFWPWVYLLLNAITGRIKIPILGGLAWLAKVAIVFAMAYYMVVSFWLTWVPSHEGSFNAVTSRAMRATGIKMPSLNPGAYFPVEEPARYGPEVPTASTPYPLPPESK